MGIFDMAHEWLMQNTVLPFLYYVGWMDLAEDANFALDWFLLGILQLCVIAFIFRPLESSERPEVFGAGASNSMQDWGADHRQAIRVDLIYTVINRLGIFHVFFFFFFSEIFISLSAQLHDFRFERWNVELWWPGVTSNPLVSLFIYLILFDFVDYWYHRISHRFGWWWQLHALHHSQQHMTSWSDNRNHFVDDLIRAIVFSSVALLVGVEPGQFLLIIMLSELIQSWQHGFYQNNFWYLKYVLVTPQFHRLHHAIDLGYEAPGRPGVLGGCNFGVLLPWWDLLFRTASFDFTYRPTGVRDWPLPANLWAQQWIALRRSWQKTAFPQWMVSK